MAHVQKRVRGGQIRWIARALSPDGRERTKTFDRKVDAERWLTTLEASKLRGEWIDPQLGRLTFSEWAARWEATIVDLRDSTLNRDLGQVRNHLLPRFGGMQLARITTSQVRAFIAELMADGSHSPATVRKVGQTLSKILEGAVEEGLIGRNPCRGVKLPPEPRRDMVFLSPEELATLADVVDPWYRVLVLSAGYLGLRWGELAGLRPDRLDLLRRRVHVVEQLTEVNGRLGFGPPKTAAGRRSVSIPAFLVELLEGQLSERSTSELVFPSKEGEAMRRSNFRRRVWTPAVRSVGVDGLRFHDLRHTAVALAIAQGAHPKAIQERLGHSSITVTLDRYGHLFPNLDEAIAEGLDAAWREAQTGPGRDRDGTGTVAALAGR